MVLIDFIIKYYKRIKYINFNIDFLIHSSEMGVCGAQHVRNDILKGLRRSQQTTLLIIY